MPARRRALFFFDDPASTAIYTLSLHDALPISAASFPASRTRWRSCASPSWHRSPRPEEHTSELQSRRDLGCRPRLEKKKGARWGIRRASADLASADFAPSTAVARVRGG